MFLKIFCFIFTILLFFRLNAEEKIVLKDPVGDDKGPGTYKYPKNPVYKSGSFDITYTEIEEKGGKVEFRVGVRSKIEDPWNSKAWGGNGFSLQFVQIYIDMDHKEGSGFKEGLPGLNIEFKNESLWEKVILISPQGKTRLQAEINEKAKKQEKGIIIPKITRAKGKELIAVVDIKDLGEKINYKWGFQVVMQSNEGYPDRGDLLTRKVNEYEGDHRFGGGSDYNCDPHVIDIFAPPASGSDDEIKKQYEILKYRCDEKEPDKSPRVQLPMVYKY